MSHDQELCLSCRSPKVTKHCSLCAEPVCKSCIQFLDENTFTYRTEIADELKHSFYCIPCFDSTVAPARELYEQTLEAAKQLTVISNAYRGPLKIIKKAQRPIQLKECTDRNEAILRLAFMSVEQGFNAIINVDVVTTKHRNHGHQKSSWSASAFPANIDEARLVRDEYLEEVWRRGH